MVRILAPHMLEFHESLPNSFWVPCRCQNIVYIESEVLWYAYM